jgi:geranyl-CoA carboxylase alpha subunit
MADFTKVLVANRGEIALRVMRTCKRLGLATVAVYSDADRNAPHVAFADEALRIGPAPARESYLLVEAIIAAARTSGAQAIHPGYGFLSENPALASACEAAGLTFIGPSAEVIALMGDKRRAKQRMRAAGVPCIPGYDGDEASDEVLLEQARRLGVPLMIKAAAGGGGRGMRLVTDLAQVPSALRAARSEAESAFGNGALLLERAIEHARHVEVQVFGDSHGTCVHLGERDCSIQRRHQKIVEETPSPAVDAELRRSLGETAVTAARTIGYQGAGTIEFLLAPSGEFYFMEMNTRLQVEHPITEAITGLDLVEWQLLVAAGQPLPVSQDALRFVGHAIEVRLCAEDVRHGFLPQTGVLLAWGEPVGEGVRVDHGLREGNEVTPFYDSLQAKVIAFGAERETARRRLARALDAMVILGVVTNKSFLQRVLEEEAFRTGVYDTDFVARHYPALETSFMPSAHDLALAAAVLVHSDAVRLQEAVGYDDSLTNWTSSLASALKVRLANGDSECTLAVRAVGRARYEVMAEGQRYELELITMQAPRLIYRLNGVDRAAHWERTNERLWLEVDGGTHVFDDISLRPGSVARDQADGRLLAPMTGKIIALHAQPGQSVKKGQELLVLESMKMELPVTAAVDGSVLAVHTVVGSQVGERQLLVTLAPA